MKTKGEVEGEHFFPSSPKKSSSHTSSSSSFSSKDKIKPSERDLIVIRLMLG